MDSMQLGNQNMEIITIQASKITPKLAKEIDGSYTRMLRTVINVL